MKYPLITALAPANEHVDMEAVNEGIWLSQEHVNKIEAELAADKTPALTAEIDALKQKLSNAENSLKDAQADNERLLQENNQQLQQIEELKAAAIGFENPPPPADDFNHSTGKEKYLNNEINRDLRKRAGIKN